MLVGFLDTEALWLQSTKRLLVCCGRASGPLENTVGGQKHSRETPNVVIHAANTRWGNVETLKQFCVIAPLEVLPWTGLLGKKTIETSCVRLGYFWHQQCLAA